MSKKIILVVILVLIIQFVGGIIFFEIDPENTNVNFSPAESESVTDKTIRFDENGKLKSDAEVVLSFLREECGAKGELGKGGSPYFYDRNNK